MLVSIKLATMAAGLMFSTFQGSNLQAFAYGNPLETTESVTEYSIETGGAPVLASWKSESPSP
jgi:hypothetical protein